MKNPGDRFRCPFCGYMVFKKDEVGHLYSGGLAHLECADLDAQQHRQMVVDLLDLCVGCREQYL